MSIHGCAEAACEAAALTHGGRAQVNQLYIAPDVVEDYDSGLEYGTAARMLRMVQRGDEREFLVQCAPCPMGLAHTLHAPGGRHGATPLLAAAGCSNQLHFGWYVREQWLV